MVTHSRRLNGNNFGIACQFGSEEDDRDEDEQRTEHVHVVRNKRQVIIKYNLLQRDLVLEEIVHLFRQVENDGDTEYQHNREEERAEELTDNIPIETLQEIKN